MKEIHAPVYSVTGNHDEQYPGPPIQELLRYALEVNQVMDIEGQIVEFDEFRLLGVGDLGLENRYARNAGSASRQTLGDSVA